MRKSCQNQNDDGSYGPDEYGHFFYIIDDNHIVSDDGFHSVKGTYESEKGMHMYYEGDNSVDINNSGSSPQSNSYENTLIDNFCDDQIAREELKRQANCSGVISQYGRVLSDQERKDLQKTLSRVEQLGTDTQSMIVDSKKQFIEYSQDLLFKTLIIVDMQNKQYVFVVPKNPDKSPYQYPQNPYEPPCKNPQKSQDQKKCKKSEKKATKLYNNQLKKGEDRVNKAYEKSDSIEKKLLKKGITSSEHLLPKTDDKGSKIEFKNNKNGQVLRDENGAYLDRQGNSYRLNSLDNEIHVTTIDGRSYIAGSAPNSSSPETSVKPVAPEVLKKNNVEQQNTNLPTINIASGDQKVSSGKVVSDSGNDKIQKHYMYNGKKVTVPENFISMLQQKNNAPEEDRLKLGKQGSNGLKIEKKQVVDKVQMDKFKSIKQEIIDKGRVRRFKSQKKDLKSSGKDNKKNVKKSESEKKNQKLKKKIKKLLRKKVNNLQTKIH